MELVKVKLGLKEFMEGNEIILPIKHKEFSELIDTAEGFTIQLDSINKIIINSRMVSPQGQVVINHRPEEVEFFTLPLADIKYYYSIPESSDEYKQLIEEFTGLKMTTNKIIQ
jgi:hypothetical protein